ncbi:hypothetical protein [Pseudoclavibacter endophyticus]|uniref:PH domain-containing protein n=1 Tax=Pseudoclavibacter endophyticus TaxID=1778590 RepID=A0A6H9WP30_9MICO|nr:hypothetical protein [Pseudoclavibacter endophyticus]KAB1648376.1 hypothetical protein F8O04_11865 [Pseudoclavibacter endophyticus]
MLPASRHGDAQEPDDADLIARFPFVGPGERAMLAITVVVCAAFAIPCLLELLAAMSIVPWARGETDLWILVVGTAFFGLPALLSAIVAIRPPKRDIVVDTAGIRIEGARNTYAVDWSEVRAIAVSVTWPNPFGAATPPRRRMRRGIHILFGPVDPAADLPPSLLPWRHTAGFTHALKLVTSPLTGDNPPIVRGLADAMRVAVPDKFAGVLYGHR